MLYKVSYCTLVYDKVVVHMYNEIRRTPKCHTTLSYTSKMVYHNFVVHCHTTLLYTLVSHNFVVHPSVIQKLLYTIIAH